MFGVVRGKGGGGETGWREKNVLRGDRRRGRGPRNRRCGMGEGGGGEGVLKGDGNGRKRIRSWGRGVTIIINFNQEGHCG